MENRSLGIDVQATIDDAQSKLQDLLATIQNLPDTIASVISLDVTGEDVLQEAQNSLNDIDGTSATADLNVDAGNSEDTLKDINNEVEDLDGKSANAEVNVDDGASGPISDINAELDDLDGRSVEVNVNVGEGNASTTVNKTNESLDTTKSLAEVVGEKIGIIGATILGVNTIGSSFTIEKELELANYHGGGTVKTLEQLREKVLSLTSASVSGEQVAESLAKMGEQGASATDQIELIGPAMDLVKTKQADASTVGQFAAQIMQRYGISAKEAADDLTYMNAAALHTSYSGEQWISIMNKADKSAGALGLSFKEQTNVIGSLASSGKDYTQVMMAMRSGLSGFRKEVDPTNKEVTGAEKAIQSMGISFKDANGHIKSQKEILKETLDKLAEMPDGQEKTRLATEIFGDTVGQTFAKLKKGPSEFGDETEKAGDKTIKKTKEIKAANMDLFDHIKKLTNQAASWFAGIPTAAKLAMEGILLYLGADAFLGTLNKIKPTEFVTKLMDKLGLNKFNGFVIDKLKDVGKTIKSFFDDAISKIFKTGIKVDENGLIKMIEIKPGQYQAETSKLSNFINDIKSKVKSLKDSNIFKMIFGDQKGTVSLPKFNIPKLPSFKWSSIPEIKLPNLGILKSLTGIFDSLAGAGKVVGPILRVAGVVGDFFAIVAGGIEALFNIEDYFSGDKSIFSFVTNTFIAPLAEVIGGKGASDKLKGAAESLDKDIKNAIGGPMDWLNTVAGPGFTKAVQNALGPIGQTMRDLFKGDVLKNITDLITQPFKDLLKDGPVEHTKRGFDKLWDYLTPIGKMIEDRIKGIKIPNLMELIFGKKDNKDNPVDKFINDIKTKIAGFIPWLQSIKLPSILDLLFGNTGKKDKNTANPVDKFIADIKAKIGGLKAWLLTNIPKAPSINWKPLSQGLQDVYSWVTKKYNDLKNWIKTHTPKIPTLSWGNLTTGLKKAVDWVQGKFNDLLNFLKGLPKKMKDFGKKIMQGLADGLAEKFKAVKDILKYISDHFPKSPPKTGPLSEVTPENMYLFGGSLGSGLSEGLDSKTNQVFNNLGNANGVLYNAPTSAAAVNDNSSSDINIDKVEVTVPESVGSKEEAYLYGQSAASGLVDELKGQATNAGILSR